MERSTCNQDHLYEKEFFLHNWINSSPMDAKRDDGRRRSKWISFHNSLKEGFGSRKHGSTKARQIKYLLFHFLSSQQQQLDLTIFHFRLFNKFSSTRRLMRYREEHWNFESLLSLSVFVQIFGRVVLETLTGCWWILSRA